jgi:hypothetical protein
VVEVSDARTRSGCWGRPCGTTSWQRLLAVGQQRGGQSGSVAEATEQSTPADTCGSRHLVRGGAVRAKLVEQSRGPECRPAAARSLRGGAGIGAEEQSSGGSCSCAPCSSLTTTCGQGTTDPKVLRGIGSRRAPRPARPPRLASLARGMAAMSGSAFVSCLPRA